MALSPVAQAFCRRGRDPTCLGRGIHPIGVVSSKSPTTLVLASPLVQRPMRAIDERGISWDDGGMSLTPVAPTGSGSVSGGLPSHAPGARSPLRDRASVPRVLGAAPLGAGVRVPRLRRDRGVAHRARAVDVRGLWTSGVGDRGHHFPGDPYSVVRLVPGDLVGGQPKKWRQRAWPTARARLGQLPHGVDVAAQAATRDGAAWPGPGVGGGRGGRDPRGRARGGRRPPTPGEEGAGGHCGRGAGPGHRPHPDAAGGRCLTPAAG